MSSKNTYFSLWVTAGIGFLFVLALLLMGSILTIGNNLAQIHPYLSVVFYIFTVVVFIILIIRPVMAVFSTPQLIKVSDFVDDDATTPDKSHTIKAARVLLKQNRLEKTEKQELAKLLSRDEDPSELLEKIFDARLERMDAIVRSHARQVFISTALSQNGRLDALLAIMINFRMLRAMVKEYGYRPSYRELIKTYTKVLAAALIADGIEDIEFAEVFPVLSKGFIGIIPGLGLLSSSVLQGAGNAFLTLRIGIITRNYYLTAGQGFSRRHARRSAIRPALNQLRMIIKESVSIFPRELQRKAKEMFSFI